MRKLFMNLSVFDIGKFILKVVIFHLVFLILFVSVSGFSAKYINLLQEFILLQGFERDFSMFISILIAGVFNACASFIAFYILVFLKRRKFKKDAIFASVFTVIYISSPMRLYPSSELALVPCTGANP